MKLIKAKLCIECGRFNLGNYNKCSNCLNHCRRGRLVEVDLLLKKEVLDEITKEINIQKEFLKKQPKNKKSISWRIVGMKVLKEKFK